MRRLLIIILLLCMVAPLHAQEFSIIDYLLNSASASDSEFTIFLFILSQTDSKLLNDFGRTDTEWTVFAPSDAAFREFMKANGLHLRDLVTNEDLLRNLLHYHIVEGAYSYADLVNIDSIAPLLDNTEINITVSDDGTIYLNDNAEIIVENVPASNGVLHVINQVLTTPTIREALNIPEMTPEAEATETVGG